MINTREVVGFFMLIALVYGVGQTELARHSFQHFLDAVNLWYYRMLG